MAVTSVVQININFSGDIEYGQQFDAAANSSSPGLIDGQTLALGANVITVPSNTTGVTLVPPSANTTVITLKGISGDTGISIHRTNPTYIGLNGVSTFVLDAAAQITGFRLIWS